MDKAWAEDVRAAMVSADSEALARLFDAAVTAEGKHEASKDWLDAVSAFDADAVTG